MKQILRMNHAISRRRHLLRRILAFAKRGALGFVLTMGIFGVGLAPASGTAHSSLAGGGCGGEAHFNKGNWHWATLDNGERVRICMAPGNQCYYVNVGRMSVAMDIPNWARNQTGS